MKLFIKCFFKLETLESILEKHKHIDSILYISKNGDFLFRIIDTNKNDNEVIAKMCLKQGFSSCNSIGIYDSKIVSKYINNQNIFSKIFVEEETHVANLYANDNDEAYNYINYKITVAIPSQTKVYIKRNSILANNAFVLLDF